MEMSAAYMKQAADFFASHGFNVEEQNAVLGEVGGRECTAQRFVLRRAESEHFVLEVVHHPEEGERYFLEIIAFHGLRSFSFPLDSWRFRGKQIELKYYALADSGLGLALTFDMTAIPRVG